MTRICRALNSYRFRIMHHAAHRPREQARPGEGEGDVCDLLRKCKAALEMHYGPLLKGLILYGSFARNQATESSDIDLLVLLDKPFNYFDELWHIIDVLYPVQLESEQLISAKPALLDDYEQGTLQLYRDAKRDGVPV